MEEEAVQPQVEVQDQSSEPIHEDNSQENIEQEIRQVPLATYLKERRENKDLKAEIRSLREQKNSQEEDESRYESVTKEDLGNSQEKIIKTVEERRWIKENPERYEKVMENLEEFLKKRPNLASAIKEAPNSYEEAWELMNALSPRQQQSLFKGAAPKKEAPGSPSGVPKAASINEAVDVMQMTDSEYRKWRDSKKKRR
jgi:DNA repair exonuclease SbcCD ATPase subunit